MELIRAFLRVNDLGLVSGPGGLMRIMPKQVRGPDVAFVSCDRLPDGSVPTDPVPSIVPDLAVEVLSLGNTFAEMTRKRREYFYAGVRLVWMVDPRERTVGVYTSIPDVKVLDESAILSGGDVLPGLNIQLQQLFGELDRQRPR